MTAALCGDAARLYVRLPDGSLFGTLLQEIRLRYTVGFDENGPIRTGKAHILFACVCADRPFLHYDAWLKLPDSEKTARWTIPTDGSAMILPGSGALNASPFALPSGAARVKSVRFVGTADHILSGSVLEW